MTLKEFKTWLEGYLDGASIGEGIKEDIMSKLDLVRVVSEPNIPDNVPSFPGPYDYPVNPWPTRPYIGDPPYSPPPYPNYPQEPWLDKRDYPYKTWSDVSQPNMSSLYDDKPS